MKRICLWAALLSAGVFAVYWPSVRAPFVFDDNGKIAENPDIRDLSSIGKKLVFRYDRERKWERNDPSRPVTYLFFALNYRLGGPDPFGYHLVNIALHALNSILVLLLAGRIFLLFFRRENFIFPPAAAAFFAFHPVNSIVVCYTYNRSGELAFFFSLLSLLLFFRSGENRPRSAALSLICFVLALFSKPDAIALPGLMLVLELAFPAEPSAGGTKKRLAAHLPFWGIAAAYLLFRYFYLGGLGDLESVRNSAAWPRFSYMAVQPFVLTKYAGLLLSARGFSIEHPVAVPALLPKPALAAGWLFLAASAAAGLAAYRRGTPAARLLLFSMLWFFIALLPTSSIFPTTMPMEENRLYAAGFGFYLALAALLRSAADAAAGRRFGRLVILLLLAAAAAWILFLAASSRARSRMYLSPVSLWEEALSAAPSNPRAVNNAAVVHNNRGVDLFAAGDTAGAVAEFDRAIEIKPAMTAALENRGLINFRELDDRAAAARDFIAALAADPSSKAARENLSGLCRLGKASAAGPSLRPAAAGSGGIRKDYSRLINRCFRGDAEGVILAASAGAH